MNPEKPVPFSVSEVKFRLVPGEPDGLLGWASCVVNGALYLNNITVRRTANGIALFYPAKRSKRDQKYFFFNPISREAKEALDSAILGSLKALRTP